MVAETGKLRVDSHNIYLDGRLTQVCQNIVKVFVGHGAGFHLKIAGIAVFVKIDHFIRNSKVNLCDVPAVRETSW